MSYTTLFGVPKSGEIEILEEYSNSHGSAPAIWLEIYEKYLKANAKTEYEGYHSEGVLTQMFDSEFNKKLESHELSCLLLTGDNCMVKRENVKELCESLLKMWVQSKERNPQNVNHLKKISEDLQSLSEQHTYVAFCFNWTSVCDDMWQNKDRHECDCEFCTKEDDSHWLWDISKNKGHWFLFDEKVSPSGD